MQITIGTHSFALVSLCSFLAPQSSRIRRRLLFFISARCSGKAAGRRGVRFLKRQRRAETKTARENGRRAHVRSTCKPRLLFRYSRVQDSRRADISAREAAEKREREAERERARKGKKKHSQLRSRVSSLDENTIATDRYTIANERATQVRDHGTGK